jgi:hypothetical protein
MHVWLVSGSWGAQIGKEKPYSEVSCINRHSTSSNSNRKLTRNNGKIYKNHYSYYWETSNN